MIDARRTTTFRVLTSRLQCFSSMTAVAVGGGGFTKIALSSPHCPHFAIAVFERLMEL